MRSSTLSKQLFKLGLICLSQKAQMNTFILYIYMNLECFLYVCANDNLPFEGPD